MTSNAGSANKESALGFGKTQQDATRDRVMKALSDFLRPEFLARVDEIVLFRSLEESDFRDIARLMLDEYVGTLKERSILFTYDDAAVEWLAKHAIGGKSGARDLRNLIRRRVEDALAEQIIAHADQGLAGVTLPVQNDEPTLLTLEG